MIYKEGYPPDSVRKSWKVEDADILIPGHGSAFSGTIYLEGERHYQDYYSRWRPNDKPMAVAQVGIDISGYIDAPRTKSLDVWDENDLPEKFDIEADSDDWHIWVRGALATRRKTTTKLEYVGLAAKAVGEVDGTEVTYDFGFDS